MKLPTCPNCQHSFTWKEACRAATKTKRFTYCPNCQTTLYPTANSLTKSALVFALLQLIFLVVLSALNLPIGIAVLALAIYLALFLAYMPYGYQYNEYEDSLFKL
ncbi:TIGR04104 family putative zinc finger protein [Paenibacillus wulumuqiensis]|uniref:TIGR04104 family putative zinc finger protein n=1 Tax=Paenibacillus wulumuqiensis TaxID=1567107 RepID=UPI000619AD5C|nr:TIGR04104 family putative zinc finger protein [Paenibacillus wulumuqiensis]